MTPEWLRRVQWRRERLVPRLPLGRNGEAVRWSVGVGVTDTADALPRVLQGRCPACEELLEPRPHSPDFSPNSHTFQGCSRCRLLVYLHIGTREDGGVLQAMRQS